MTSQMIFLFANSNDPADSGSRLVFNALGIAQDAVLVFAALALTKDLLCLLPKPRFLRRFLSWLATPFQTFSRPDFTVLYRSTDRV